MENNLQGYKVNFRKMFFSTIAYVVLFIAVLVVIFLVLQYSPIHGLAYISISFVLVFLNFIALNQQFKNLMEGYRSRKIDCILLEESLEVKEDEQIEMINLNQVKKYELGRLPGNDGYLFFNIRFRKSGFDLFFNTEENNAGNFSEFTKSFIASVDNFNSKQLPGNKIGIGKSKKINS